MRASQLVELLDKLIDKKVPVFLWGSPGIGKSSIVKQIAKAKSIGFIDLRLSLMDPTDLKGIPFYDKEHNIARWASPSFLPTHSKGILFLDELNSAMPTIQASAYQLILDRCIGEYSLPDGWAIVAAGNKDSDRALTYRMPTPLANRFVHFELELNVADWRLWAFGAGIDSRIIAYISFRGEHLFTFNPSSEAKSFATPRSWEFVDMILKSGLKQELLYEAISGAISSEVALEFLSFIKVMDSLPNLEDIFRGECRNYPNDVETLFTLSSALVSEFLNSSSDERLENLLKYLLELKSEFSIKIVQDLQKSGVKMEHLDAFSRWVDKFSLILN